MFTNRQCGKTLVSRTQGTKIATEELKGRVLEVNLADLNNDEDQASKKVRLCIEEVQGRNCLTDFHGMTLTRDKICSLIKKWQTLIEAHVDVKTTDGYVVRMFCVAFTKRRPDQVKANCYAQSAQIRKIRRKMVDIMTQEASKVQLRELVKKLIPESIGKEIEKQAQGTFPLKDCLIRKVKILKKPKFDITKLMELHGDGGDDAGVEMVRPETEEAMNTLTADIVAQEVLAGRLRFLGVLNVLLVPPVLIFVAIYFFMRHAQEFRSQRASPFRRQWSDYAQWTFREYNELPHQIEARMSAGHAAAEAYVHTTRPSSPVLKSALRCVKFIAGSVLAALLLVALWDDTPLLFVKIQEKNLLWYLAFFGFVFAVVDSAGEENAGDAEGKGSGSEACLHAPSVPLRMYIALMKLVSCTHHLPAHWRSPERLTSLAGACSGLRRASLCQHFRLVRQELLRDFLVHRIQVLAEELLGVLLSPILLFCFLSHAAPGIVRVLRRVRYATPCLGDFCLYGCLDPDRSGDFGVGAASSADSRRTLRRQFENDKLEKSILSFLLNHQLLWSPDDGADGFMFIRGQELQNELSERSWRQPTVPAIQLQELKHADDAAPLEWHADGPPGSMHPIEVVEQEAEGWHAEGPEGPHDRAREQQEFVLAHVLGVPPAAVAVLHEVQEFHEVETKENPSGEDYALLPSELLYLPSIVPGASASKAIATAAKTVVDEGQAKDKGDIFGALFFWLEALRKYQGNPVQMCESDDEGGGVFFRQPHTELTV
ncbi:unnamed protein product [Effrenium voratum]|nr:unnamed protein product [Effrenium voratum]